MAESHLGAAFAARLSARRKARCITQQALAERIGTQVSVISKWENGRSMPKHVGVLIHLAQELGCTVEWLATGNGAEDAAAA